MRKRCRSGLFKLFRWAWTTHNSIAKSFHHRNVHSLHDEDVVLAQEDEIRLRGGLKLIGKPPLPRIRIDPVAVFPPEPPSAAKAGGLHAATAPHH
jgi:hypothetical protein